MPVVLVSGKFIRTLSTEFSFWIKTELLRENTETFLTTADVSVPVLLKTCVEPSSFASKRSASVTDIVPAQYSSSSSNNNNSGGDDTNMIFSLSPSLLFRNFNMKQRRRESVVRSYCRCANVASMHLDDILSPLRKPRRSDKEKLDNAALL